MSLEFKIQTGVRSKNYTLEPNGLISGKTYDGKNKLETEFTPSLINAENMIGKIVENSPETLPNKIVCSDGVIENIQVEQFEELPEEYKHLNLDQVYYLYVEVEKTSEEKDQVTGILKPYTITKTGNLFNLISWDNTYANEHFEAEHSAVLAGDKVIDDNMDVKALRRLVDLDQAA